MGEGYSKFFNYIIITEIATKKTTDEILKSSPEPRTWPISTELGTMMIPRVKGTQAFTNIEHSILKNEIMLFSAPNQSNDITIALLKCVY